MKISQLYLIGAVVGTILPLSEFIPFLNEHGLNATLFFEQLWATRISSFFGWDVFVSTTVLLVFITAEGQRLSRTEKLVCYAASVLIGCSAGLPLFLYLRQLRNRVQQPTGLLTT